jgi:hypothetical protein
MVDAKATPKQVTREDIPSFGFVGLMASGKSTYGDSLGRQLEETFKFPIYRTSFSTKIAEIARDLFDMKGKDRRLLQDIGAKMKEIDPAVWAKQIVREIKANGRAPFIVDGIRSIPEAQAFRDGFPDFIIIRIESDEQQRLEAYKRAYGRYPAPEETSNITERTVDGIRPDITFTNVYSQEVLAGHIRGIVHAISDGTITSALGR